MTNGLWILDDDGQEIYLTEQEIEEGTRTNFKPLAGFVFPSTQFLALKLVQYPFYIRDWLPKMGKAMLVAPRKAGKSTLMIQAARCIGAGEPFLGIPTTQGKVLYIQCEMGQALLQQKMADTGQDYENVFVGTLFNLKIDRPEGQELLQRAMEAVQPHVLILDPLIKIISGDENEAVDMLKVTDYLDTLIEAYNSSVIVVHHMGKDEKRGGRGTSLFAGWVDSYIEIKVREYEPVLKISVRPTALRHAALPPAAIDLELVNHEFQPADAVLHVSDKVAAYFEEHIGQVVETGTLKVQGWGSPRLIHDALNVMVASGEIVALSRGKYIMPAQAVPDIETKEEPDDI